MHVYPQIICLGCFDAYSLPNVEYKYLFLIQSGSICIRLPSVVTIRDFDVVFISTTDVTKSTTDPIMAEPGYIINFVSLILTTPSSSFLIAQIYSSGVVFPGTPPKNPPPISIYETDNSYFLISLAAYRAIAI